MTFAALGLLILAAFLHAGWNLLVKKSAGGGIEFVWLFAAVSCLIYAPIVFLWTLHQPFLSSGSLWLCIISSAFFHACYFVSLQEGYRYGDLSVVYPLARGTGPLVTTVLAIFLLHENPSRIALLGLVLIVIGVFFIASCGANGLKLHLSNRLGILYGLLTGAFIASYTLVDKYAVSTLVISPLVYNWLCNVFRVLLLLPLVIGRGKILRKRWTEFRMPILAVGFLGPLAYILILTAMSFTPVSYVAPAREISILVGVVIGGKILEEKNLMGRLGASGAIVLGVIALMVG